MSYGRVPAWLASPRERLNQLILDIGTQVANSQGVVQGCADGASRTATVLLFSEIVHVAGFDFLQPFDHRFREFHITARVLAASASVVLTACSVAVVSSSLV